MVKQGDSIILRENLNNYFKSKKKQLNEYDISVIDLDKFCHNLYCKEYDFYRNENVINSDSSISLAQLSDIMGNHNKYLQYTFPEAAHIIPLADCKELGGKYYKRRNEHKNGIFLCHNCHKYFDHGNGDWVQTQELKDYHQQHMDDIQSSKIIWDKSLV